MYGANVQVAHSDGGLPQTVQLSQSFTPDVCGALFYFSTATIVPKIFSLWLQLAESCVSKVGACLLWVGCVS